MNLTEKNPAIGVQCPMLPSARVDEAYYNLTWHPSPDAFSVIRSCRRPEGRDELDQR